jgi:succinyl-CoA synthetase beta subunit
MRLLEFQAKRIFSRHGIPVPKSSLITSPSDVATLFYPAVLKAQVAVGGRGKSDAIRVVESASEAAVAIECLLGSTVKGHRVQAVLAEEKITIEKELYLAVLIDKVAKLPMLLATDAGGMDIERIGRDSPERIIRKHAPVAGDLPAYVLSYLAQRLLVKDRKAELSKIIEGMFAIFYGYDASLVEINPLAVTPDGLCALDAKILLDDKAEHHHSELFSHLKEEQNDLTKQKTSRSQRLAEELGVTYVPLEGEVGLISDGAGTGMLALDLICDAQGRPANFCELGGLAGAESMKQALEVVLANPKAKVLLISLIGGLTRMDEVAEGILDYLKGHSVKIPLIVRMYGTKEDVGRAMLREAGIETVTDLPEAVQIAVAGARVS